ncbi:methyl farnesoate epoxidase-like [Prorops nasuta]|uniref:methyl farnesoate epoxidase-like n=1 Tax=Prorops nasuta TaxID=863751 RepID=UPI0034CEA114
MLYWLLWLLLALALYFVFDSCKPSKFPPGPPWLPLVGCYPLFQKLRSKYGYTYLAFQEISKKYGPIVGLKLGNQKIVFISSYDLVKEALLRDEFNGRPDGFFFRVRSFGERRGILFKDGQNWSQCRNFTVKHMRTFGWGRSTMANQLSLEAEHLVEYLKRQSECGAVAMHTAFDISVLNALWFLFAGHRFHYGDPRIQDILPLIHEAFRLMDTMGGIMSQMPFLRFVIPEISGYNDLMRILRKLWSYLDEEIKNHEENLDDAQPKDLIDTFLLEIASHGAEEDTIFERKNLLILCLDLFLAGSKTTTDTLAMTFAFISHNTEWIKILQNEMDRVVGRSRLPCLDDYSFLPMMEAFLNEAQRFLVLAPLGLPHRTMKNSTLKGYQIPKDTIILLDFHSAHNDEAYWEKPEEFRPQRFLDDKGQFQQSSATLAFGLGKRRCMGENLARSSLFLYFASVIHKFDVEMSPEHDQPDLNGFDGFTVSPKPYHLKLKLRTDNNADASLAR